MPDTATDRLVMDSRAHRHAIKLPRDQVLQQLVLQLGEGLVALLAGVKGNRSVRQWMRREHELRPEVERRLRFALYVGEVLGASESREVVEAWFLGCNPILGDRRPVDVLGDDDQAEAERNVLRAARDFVSG